MNKSIIQFNWSEKTNAKLFNLGIRNIEDFEGVSIKALQNLKIPKKIIHQIEDICKTHNIKTKETEFSIYRVTYEYEYTRETSAVKNIKDGVTYNTIFIETGLYSVTTNYVANSLDAVEKYIKEECKINGYEYKRISELEISSLLDDCTNVGLPMHVYIKPIKVTTREVK